MWLNKLNILYPIHCKLCLFLIDFVCTKQVSEEDCVLFKHAAKMTCQRKRQVFLVGFYLYIIINGAVIARNTPVSKCKLWSDSTIILSKREKSQYQNR